MSQNLKLINIKNHTKNHNLKLKTYKYQNHTKNLYVFIWFLIVYKSDDGLIVKPKLVTCKTFLNLVVHDGGLEH
jgi:hypothetical protein